MSRPELLAPPEIFYDDVEARKYTSSTRIIEIQAKLSDRALELLALPKDGVPKLLLDIGCGSGLSGETLSESGHQWIGLDISESMLNVASEREVEGDLLLGDMGQGLGIRPGVIDGAVSISAVQVNVQGGGITEMSSGLTVPTPMWGFLRPLLFWAFFGSLYRCLARGARAVFQVYPENNAQRELILGFAMRSGFSGGIVIDYPHSTKSRKEYLVLSCGPPSLERAVERGKGEDGASSSDDDDDDDDDDDVDDDDDSGDEDIGTVTTSERQRPRKRQKIIKNKKGREWVMKKKEQMRRRGHSVPEDSKYTSRKRKTRF